MKMKALMILVFLMCFSTNKIISQESNVIKQPVLSERIDVVPVVGEVNANNNTLTKWTGVTGTIEKSLIIGNSSISDDGLKVIISRPLGGVGDLLEVHGSFLNKGAISLMDKLLFTTPTAEIVWGDAWETESLKFTAIGINQEELNVMTLNGRKGFVGIGTGNPTSMLHLYSFLRPEFKLQNGIGELVIGVANNPGDFAPTSLPGDVVFKTHTSADQHGMIFNMNNTGSDGNSYIKFNDQDNYNTLVIRNDGRVGVGVAEPAYTFQVNGTTFTKQFILFDEQNPPLDGYVLQSDATGNAKWSQMDIPEPSPWLPSGTSNIYYYGGVGIGTINSTTYALAVKGSIITDEVMVKHYDRWPDFVFHPDFNLRTLGEVEQYIRENNHLPDVPSAKEVDENGFAIGEMNAILLQKIEELTLYILVQEKRLDQQDIEIQKLINRTAN